MDKVDLLNKLVESGNDSMSLEEIESFGKLSLPDFSEVISVVFKNATSRKFPNKEQINLSKMSLNPNFTLFFNKEGSDNSRNREFQNLVMERLESVNIDIHSEIEEISTEYERAMAFLELTPEDYGNQSKIKGDQVLVRDHFINSKTITRRGALEFLLPSNSKEYIYDLIDKMDIDEDNAKAIKAKVILTKQFLGLLEVSMVYLTRQWISNAIKKITPAQLKQSNKDKMEIYSEMSIYIISKIRTTVANSGLEMLKGGSGKKKSFDRDQASFLTFATNATKFHITNVSKEIFFGTRVLGERYIKSQSKIARIDNKIKAEDDTNELKALNELLSKEKEVMAIILDDIKEKTGGNKQSIDDNISGEGNATLGEVIADDSSMENEIEEADSKKEFLKELASMKNPPHELIQKIYINSMGNSQYETFNISDINAEYLNLVATLPVEEMSKINEDLDTDALANFEFKVADSANDLINKHIKTASKKLIQQTR